MHAIVQELLRQGLQHLVGLSYAHAGVKFKKRISQDILHIY